MSDNNDKIKEEQVTNLLAGLSMVESVFDGQNDKFLAVNENFTKDEISKGVLLVAVSLATRMSLLTGRPAEDILAEIRADQLSR